MIDSTLAKIDQVVGRINTHREYSACVSREKDQALRYEASDHSLAIEEISEGKQRRERSEVLNHLSSAWNFLVNNGIDIYSLSKLGKLIEPHNQVDGLRNKEVMFGGYAAPGPNQVPQLMDDLIGRLNGSYPIHPVARAVDAHLAIVEIHPFEDGNGRAARLLQNFCLKQRGLPPAIIKKGERQLYFHLIDAVHDDRYTGKSSVFEPSTAEKAFTEFIALKILDSAEQLDNELRSRRSYDVELTKVEPGTVHTIANLLRGYGKRPGNSGVTVNVDKKNGHAKRGEKMRITGDISATDLIEILKTMREKHNFRYHVDVNPECRSSNKKH